MNIKGYLFRHSRAVIAFSSISDVRSLLDHEDSVDAFKIVIDLVHQYLHEDPECSNDECKKTYILRMYAALFDYVPSDDELSNDLRTVNTLFELTLARALSLSSDSVPEAEHANEDEYDEAPPAFGNLDEFRTHVAGYVDGMLLSESEEAWREDVVDMINGLAHICFSSSLARGFWDSALELRDDGQVNVHANARNVGEMIALMHSELSEALEAARTSAMDSHLPEYSGVLVELADTIIRIFDFAAGSNLDIGKALMDKLVYNAKRPYKHGKQF